MSAIPPPVSSLLRNARLRELVRVVVWFALLTGLSEAAILLLRRHVLNQFTWASAQISWMAPLAYLVLFAAVGIIFFFLVKFYPERVSLRAFVFCLAFMCSFGILLTLSNHRLHNLAVLVLAAGVSSRVSHLVKGNPAPFNAIVRRTLPPMVAAWAVLLIGSPIWKLAAERRALSLMPPARGGAPNVLLIILDTVRAASLSLYGYARPTTPWLDQWSQKGVVFERALATAPWTLPSHASMFTGRWPHEFAADWLTPLDGEYPTVAELLREQGYITAGFVANSFYCSYETGLARGFMYYTDYPTSPQQIVKSAALVQLVDSALTERSTFRRTNHRQSARHISRAFLDWLRTKKERPFFAFLNYFDAHAPYESPGEYRLSFSSDSARVGRYDASIAYLDHEVSSLLKELERQGTLRNTLVIITSDHGEQLGEHGLFEHGNSLYFPLLHVPLILRFPPQVPQGIRVSHLVSLRDLAATILDLVGAERPSSLPGTSLRAQWEAGVEGVARTTPIFSELTLTESGKFKRGGLRSVVIGDTHYIRWNHGYEELYDLAADPQEARNLAPEPSTVARLIPLRDLIDSIQSAAR